MEPSDGTRGGKADVVPTVLAAAAAVAVAGACAVAVAGARGVEEWDVPRLLLMSAAVPGGRLGAARDAGKSSTECCVCEGMPAPDSGRSSYSTVESARDEEADVAEEAGWI